MKVVWKPLFCLLPTAQDSQEREKWVHALEACIRRLFHRHVQVNFLYIHPSLPLLSLSLSLPPLSLPLSLSLPLCYLVSIKKPCVITVMHNTCSGYITLVASYTPCANTLYSTLFIRSSCTCTVHVHVHITCTCTCVPSLIL